jgi:3-hydroxy-9,10-secoandrosta-1,3,5(10)-triene-9,17-dione monooxygenase
MNAPGRPASFAGVGYDEAHTRARALVPALRERAARAEQARRLPPETEAELHASGLFRITQPKRWGGMELDFVSMLEIPAELARGCASTSWIVGNITIHHWVLALYDERAQEEVWGADPDVQIASGIAYQQGRARKVDGGYVVSGTWNFSSGVDYEVIDDWHVLGMRATCSKTVRANEVFVPEHRALGAYTIRGGAEFPGARLNPNPLYQVPLAALSSHPIVAAALGNAQAALELTCDAVKGRSTSYTGASMRDFQTVQLRVGAAGARIDAAWQLARSDCLRAQEWAARGYVPTVEEKLAIKRNAAYEVTLCTEAVDTLHALAGANGIYDSYPIQRIFRDQHALAGHFGFSFDVHGSNWGLVALGGSYKLPTL